MSFRAKQRFYQPSCCAVLASESKTLETGIVEVKAVDLCKKELPKPELFDLETNIKAGVNLEEVSSKLFNSRSLSLDDMVKFNNEQINNNNEEVNNEN